MSKYWVGVDISSGEDYTAYTIARRIRWYEKLWFRLRRKTAPHLKIVSLETYAEPKQFNSKGDSGEH